MLEVANELAAGSFDFDHLGVNLDADALGDVHRLGRKDRLHFLLALSLSVFRLGSGRKVSEVAAAFLKEGTKKP